MKIDKSAEDILDMLCNGDSIKEISVKTGKPFYDLRRKIDGLRIIFGARSITHLVHLYTKETLKSVE